MARSNKYASVNFNDIYEKKIITSSNSSNPSFSSSSSPSKNVISNSRIHGHMLVLSRPATSKPKPVILPQKQQDLSPKSPETTVITARSVNDHDQIGSEPDAISLRPQGRTGPVSPIVLPALHSQGHPTSPPLASPVGKTDRFVPPHLRPGFVGREEKPGPESVKGGQGGRGRGQFTPNNRLGENDRPKSGGGYDRIRRIGGEVEAVNLMNRPGSGGVRPSSSG